MKNTIIASIVAILCTVAICVTYSVSNASGKAKTTSVSETADSEYMTEKEAADYLGVSEDVMVMLRVNLKKLEGSYMSYTYTDDSNKEVTVVMYNKTKLDSSIEALMKDSNALNFKYVQESLNK